MVSTCHRTLVPAQWLSVRFPDVPLGSGGAAEILDALQGGTVSFAGRENRAHGCLDVCPRATGGGHACARACRFRGSVRRGWDDGRPPRKPLSHKRLPTLGTLWAARGVS